MEKMKHRSLIIYTDGGSRGNPGPGASAFIIMDDKGGTLKERAEFIGACTNNIAEYAALISALKEATKLAGKGCELTCHSDSQLMINQMKGEYKVKNARIKELHNEAKALEEKFAKVDYVSVRRTDPVIQRADSMVNEILDSMERIGRI